MGGGEGGGARADETPLTSFRVSALARLPGEPGLCAGAMRSRVERRPRSPRKAYNRTSLCTATEGDARTGSARGGWRGGEAGL